MVGGSEWSDARIGRIITGVAVGWLVKSISFSKYIFNDTVFLFSETSSVTLGHN